MGDADLLPGAAFHPRHTQERCLTLPPHTPPSLHPQFTSGTIMGDLNRRKGIIMDSSTNGDDCIIQAEVPLNAMFGYSSVLR